MNTLHDQRRPPRRGTVVILMTVMITILFAMVAVAVDVGYLNNSRTQLQASADAGALAGADALYDGGTFAQIEAERFGELNVVGNTPVDIRPLQDIQFGIWDRRTLTFTPQASIDAQTDAVRVIARRSTTRGNPINLFFGRVLGVNSAEVSASAIAEAQNGFCGGFVGIDWVHVHGNSYTDSYWSEDGPYGIQAPGSNGHVCSNGTITLEGGIVVNGNASTVQGELIDMSSGNPTVTGQLNYRPDPMYAPPIIVGDADTVNDNGNLTLTQQGHLKVTGGNLNIQPGTYWLNDFSISGSGQVTVSGPTIIYVYGTLNLAGQGILNTTQLPPNLQIYTLGPKATVTGGSDFYGVIYGPQTDVKVSGSGQFFGTVVGKTLAITPTSTSAGMHYDESVGRLLRARPRAFLVQ